MSRPSRLASPVTVGLAGLLLLTGCGDGAAPATTPSADPTASQLQAQLDMLPSVDGADRTTHTFAGTTLTETFTVPAGTPACLQVLATLGAGGYEVVAGTTPAPVDPATCRSTGDTGVDTAAGKATILAQGGSEIALTWTTTSYTVVVTAA